MLGQHYTVNPLSLVPGWAFAVVQLYRMCQGEMGIVHLPDPGGMADQPAWTMDAFGICAAAEAELRKQERPDADHR